MVCQISWPKSWNAGAPFCRGVCRNIAAGPPAPPATTGSKRDSIVRWPVLPVPSSCLPPVERLPFLGASCFLLKHNACHKNGRAWANPAKADEMGGKWMGSWKATGRKGMVRGAGTRRKWCFQQVRGREGGVFVCRSNVFPIGKHAAEHRRGCRERRLPIRN